MCQTDYIRHMGSINKARSNRIFVQLTLVFVLLSTNNVAQGQSSPSNQDFLFAATGMGLAVGIELFIKDPYLPQQAKHSAPNPFDRRMREKFYWGATKQSEAVKWSDRLIYGVSLSSLAWGPMFAKDHERSALINMEVFAVNSIVTNVVKILSARERPYSHYGTSPSRGPRDYASFFSGHASVAFSQAITNAKMLSHAYPDSENLIWTSLLSLAGTTAYLRLAGDMHYFTDIVVGACVGSLIGWTITQHELKRFDSRPSSQTGLMFTMKIPLG